MEMGTWTTVLNTSTPLPEAVLDEDGETSDVALVAVQSDAAGNFRIVALGDTERASREY